MFLLFRLVLKCEIPLQNDTTWENWKIISLPPIVTKIKKRFILFVEIKPFLITTVNLNIKDFSWPFYPIKGYITMQNIPNFLLSADSALLDSAFGKPERATKVINPGNTCLGCIPLPRARRNDSLWDRMHTRGMFASMENRSKARIWN